MKEYFKKSCNQISQILNINLCELIKANWFFTLLILVITISTLVLFCINKPENIPALWLSGFALGFSYNAYVYTKEKFRLELFDKRWDIYQNTLEFCSRVTEQGSLRRREGNDDQILKALLNAEGSFRGIGYHKTRALFGKDIWNLFDKLSKSFSYLRSGGISPEKEEETLNFVWETVNKLPEIFKPYVYFGDYNKK